jgi:hypothetical protein
MSPYSSGCRASQFRLISVGRWAGGLFGSAGGIAGGGSVAPRIDARASIGRSAARRPRSGCFLGGFARIARGVRVGASSFWSRPCRNGGRRRLPGDGAGRMSAAEGPASCSANTHGVRVLKRLRGARWRHEVCIQEPSCVHPMSTLPHYRCFYGSSP